MGDEPKAQAVFAAARQKLEVALGNSEKDADYYDSAARLDAGLGRKDQAIREARRAAELVPVAKRAVAAPHYVESLALVYAWTGETDLAMEQLDLTAKLPAGITYGELRLDPDWDNLRGDGRFEALIASLAPKP